MSDIETVQSGKKRPQSVYIDDLTTEALDSWRSRYEGQPSRSAAIRILISRALNADSDGGRNDHHSP